jgi:lipopolysaccharide/colanic/teichoic acid biosynthesis glycosyltransferase
MSTLLLALLLPLFILIYFLIKIIEGSPSLYVSKRLITPKKTITVYKFRTMVKDAKSPKYQLNELYMRGGFLDIPLESNVYTPIGRILERTQLVESLQLLNVVLGDMSIVGNRPLPQQNVELLMQFPNWQGRFDSPAGITGISQVVGKYGLQPTQRLGLERMYASIYSNPKGNLLLCDAYIIFYTLKLLTTKEYLGYADAICLLKRLGAT